jgi:hypothetical protein
MQKTCFIIALLAVLAFTACKKEEPITPDPTDTPETSITFTCQDTAHGIRDVFVGVSPQASDRDAGIFIKSGTTDNLGKVKFSSLDPQVLYYSASRTLNGTVIQRKGDVEIVKDVKKFEIVNF